jgi:hypothetical protein
MLTSKPNLIAPRCLPHSSPSCNAETTIVVIEDTHWADEATLDLLKFLGRRIQRTSALLIVTYGDEEVGSQHPLRTVQALIGDREWTAAALHQQTSGNAFFVTEILAGEAGSVPVTIRDAVLARAARLSPSSARASSRGYCRRSPVRRHTPPNNV